MASADRHAGDAANPLRQVCDGYERRVQMVLDHWLPPHTDECDEGNTQRACPRCDVLAHMQVAFGFARPLNAGESRG